MRPGILFPFLIGVFPAQALAQSLAEQLRVANGTVQVLYPTRPNVCGDGQGSISNAMGRSMLSSYESGWNGRRSQCEHGPARLVLTVLGGEVTRARIFVGPVPPAANDVRTINATANDAERWLAEMVEGGN